MSDFHTVKPDEMRAWIKEMRTLDPIVENLYDLITSGLMSEYRKVPMTIEDLVAFLMATSNLEIHQWRTWSTNLLNSETHKKNKSL